MEERVQVWLSRAGFGSRRVCESLIREARVTLGNRVVQLGEKVSDPATLRVDGQPVRIASQEVHFVLHKPRGYVSTMSDPEGRPTVADLLPRTTGRLFPVGRLDFGSEGLMVVTSDGKLAQTLMHPKHGVDKEYTVKLKEPLDDKRIQRLRRGVVEGGERLTLLSISPLPSRSSHEWYSVVLGEGRNRHIRRMMSVMPAQVLRIKRIRIGPVRIGNLEPGDVRPLSPEQVAALRAARPKSETKKAPGPRAKASRSGPGAAKSKKADGSKRSVRKPFGQARPERAGTGEAKPGRPKGAAARPASKKSSGPKAKDRPARASSDGSGDSGGRSAHAARGRSRRSPRAEGNTEQGE